MPEMPLSILVVDQDINWGRFIQSYLKRKGFEVSLSTDGLDAWRRIVKGQHNFCILNPDLPTMDGYALAEHIREQAERIPIVFMVSHQQDSEETRINCFRAGADDFIVHPCLVEEINLRIMTIQKRFRFCPIENDYRIFDLGRLRFDHAQQRLFNQDCNIRLTTKEAELLLALCLNRGKVLERDQALLAVWKSADVYNVRSMDVYISKLRRLLFQYTYSEILNVHGVGFKLLTHRDGGFKRILRRDAGRLRQRLPEDEGAVVDAKLEAVAVATSASGLEAELEEEAGGVLAAEVTQDVVTDVAVAVTPEVAVAVASEVAPVLREPVGGVSGEPTCDSTADSVGEPTRASTSAPVADSAGEPTREPVSNSAGEPPMAAEKPVADGVGSDRMACDPPCCAPPCCDTTGDSAPNDSGLPHGAPSIASVPPPTASSAHRSASSD